MRTLLLINRRSHPGQFSIENIFGAIGEQLKNTGWDVTQYVSPRLSKGVFSRLFNVIHVVCHQGEVCHIVGDVTYLALFMSRKRLIITIHDLNVYERKSGLARFLIGLLWYRIPIARARFVTTISEFTKQAILREFDVAPERIRVIPNPISGAFNFEGKMPIDAACVINILQIGTKENKNLRRVVAALGALSMHYSIRLTIVGKLPASASSVDNGSLEIVNRYDLSLAEVVDLYRQMHIVLFASTYEGFGMPVLEGQAVGRPVVASNIEPMVGVSGGAVEFIDPFSIKSIEKGVERLIFDPERVDELVERGLENVQRYSIDVIAAQYASLYDQVS